jgi:hypothetical protein
LPDQDISKRIKDERQCGCDDRAIFLH